MKSSKVEFNKWVSNNYPKLVSSAKALHNDAYDLVHHTYLRVERQNLDNVMRNPMAYFRRAMFIEATRGQFKKKYQLRDAPHYDHVAEYDLKGAIMKEELEIAMDRLAWFDRSVLKLYLEGWNLAQVARESGINDSTLHTSLHRARKKLKNVFRK